MADETIENGEQPAEFAAASDDQATTQPEAPSEVDQLRQKVEELQKLADSNRDMFLRKAAEFENYKRRTETEIGSYIRNANGGLIISLLPILNDFARSLKAGAEKKDYDSFYKGVELISNKFARVLEMQGLAPFDSVGKPFDVEYHDALLQIPREDVPPHTVIEEVERGYKLNDKILKHAKVIVSASPSTESNEQTNQEEMKA